MISHDEAEQLLEDQGRLYTRRGADLGPVLRVYLDEYTAWPSFCTIASLLPGLETFVALHEAELAVGGGGGIVVPYEADMISQAPQVQEDHDLSIAEEDALFDYYHVPIDGVAPAVEHLGSVLTPTERDGEVVEHKTDHAPNTSTAA